MSQILKVNRKPVPTPPIESIDVRLDIETIKAIMAISWGTSNNSLGLYFNTLAVHLAEETGLSRRDLWEEYVGTNVASGIYFK